MDQQPGCTDPHGAKAKRLQEQDSHPTPKREGKVHPLLRPHSSPQHSLRGLDFDRHSGISPPAGPTPPPGPGAPHSTSLPASVLRHFLWLHPLCGRRMRGRGGAWMDVTPTSIVYAPVYGNFGSWFWPEGELLQLRSIRVEWVLGSDAMGFTHSIDFTAPD